MSPRRSHVAFHLYRAMLLAYPADFRREHSEEAADLFAEVHQETRGALPRLGLWRRTVVSVMRDGWRERRGLSLPPSNTPTSRHLQVSFTRLGRDALRGVRLWGRNPIHSIVAMGSLALGVGIAAAVLNLTITLFARAPMAPNPASLAALGTIEDGSVETTFAADVAMQLMGSLSAFSDVAADRFGWVWLTGLGDGMELEGSLVSFDYFDVLGLTPSAGRLFHEADATVVAPHSVVVISDALWDRRFGRDPAIIGSAADVNGQSVRVLGVAPPGFRGLYSGMSRDLWMPHDLRDTRGEGETYAFLRAGGAFELFGRLASDQTVDTARAELDRVLGQPAWRDADTNRSPEAWVEVVKGIHPDYRSQYAGTPARSMGIAAALLLLTCLNVAGLLLSRNLGRRRELSVRLALGESRFGLMTQLAAETLPLALGAAALSLIVSAWAQELIPGWFAYGLRGLELRFDWVLVLIVLSIALGSGLLFSIVPAWLAARGDVSDGLRDGGTRVAGGGASSGQLALIAAQIGLSLMLVAGAVMMTRSMTAIISSAGSDPAAVLHYRLRPSRAGYDLAAGERFQRNVLDALDRSGAVASAAVAAVGPERGWCCAVDVAPNDNPTAEIARVDNNAVTPSFFDVLGIDLEAGRLFEPADRPGAPPVVIVNRALADRLWPGQSAVGRQIRSDDTVFDVIGVASTTHPSQPGESPVPYLYFAYWQRQQVDSRLFVRVTGPAGEASRAVYAALDAHGPDVHVGQAGTLLERVTLTHGSERALTSLLQASAGAALLVAALGLYGQLSIMVRRRRRETAIRLALGATRRRVVSGILAHTLRLVAAGAAVGLVAAWLEGHLLASYLFGVGTQDPAVLAGTIALMTIVALFAAIPPARLATRADPVTVLRND